MLTSHCIRHNDQDFPFYRKELLRSWLGTGYDRILSSHLLTTRNADETLYLSKLPQSLSMNPTRAATVRMMAYNTPTARTFNYFLRSVSSLTTQAFGEKSRECILQP
jgi:hypothetical protein